MKNRTIIGIICCVLAVVIMFVVAPIFSQMAENNVECIRLKTDVLRGTQITNEHLETVSVPGYAIPTGAYKSRAEVLGKYATSQLYAGDYLSAGKLSVASISAADALENLGEGKVAISVPITSFAGSLSGKLQNGDVVRVWLRGERENDEATVPEELQWVKIITTTTGDGIDKDQIIVNEDGSFSMPSTVTLVVSELQAKRLVECSDESMYLTLVYRGNEEETKKLLDKQEAVLKEIEERLEQEKYNEEG